MTNIPKMKVGIVAVSRDCFPESLSVNRRKALVDAYTKKYDAADIRRLMSTSARYVSWRARSTWCRRWTI